MNSLHEKSDIREIVALGVEALSLHDLSGTGVNGQTVLGVGQVLVEVLLECPVLARHCAPVEYVLEHEAVAVRDGRVEEAAHARLCPSHLLAFLLVAAHQDWSQ